MRRAFQITLLLVAFVPFVLGAMNFFLGAVRFVPDELVTARLDSQMRFSAVWSMLPFLLTIWIVRNLQTAGPVLVTIVAATAAAGVARVISAIQYGLPEPAMIGIITFEIAVLLFIPWHRAILRRTKREKPLPEHA